VLPFIKKVVGGVFVRFSRAVAGNDVPVYCRRVRQDWCICR
jgi:hypothetical protein